MTAAVDDLVPRAEVLRPGLLVLPVRGAARYFGSEQAAAERLVDAVAAAGAECQVGIADRLPTAVFAARAGRIIEPGKDAVFLSALSIRQLATEPSLAAPAARTWRICCGAWESGTSGSSPPCPEPMWPPGSVPTR